MRKKALPSSARRNTLTTGMVRLEQARVPSADALLTVADAAKILHVSRGLVYALIVRGELASVTFHRIRRIRGSDLEQFIKHSWNAAQPPTTTAARPRERPPQGRLSKWRHDRERK